MSEESVRVVLLLNLAEALPVGAEAANYAGGGFVAPKELKEERSSSKKHSVDNGTYSR